MKKERTKPEWLAIALKCEAAHLLAPWYSPMRLFFSYGAKHARRKAEQAPE
jgi:hypothetical protein